MDKHKPNEKIVKLSGDEGHVCVNHWSIEAWRQILYNELLMRTLMLKITGFSLGLLIIVSSAASARPEPLISLRLLRDDHGTIKVHTQSGDGAPLRVLLDTASANSILFEHQRTVGVGERLSEDRFIYFPFTDRVVGFRKLGLFTLKLGKHRFSSNSWFMVHGSQLAFSREGLSPITMLLRGEMFSSIMRLL